MLTIVHGEIPRKINHLYFFFNYYQCEAEDYTINYPRSLIPLCKIEGNVMITRAQAQYPRRIYLVCYTIEWWSRSQVISWTWTSALIILRNNCWHITPQQLHQMPSYLICPAHCLLYAENVIIHNGAAVLFCGCHNNQHQANESVCPVWHNERNNLHSSVLYLTRGKKQSLINKCVCCLKLKIIQHRAALLTYYWSNGFFIQSFIIIHLVIIIQITYSFMIFLFSILYFAFIFCFILSIRWHVLYYYLSIYVLNDLMRDNTSSSVLTVCTHTHMIYYTNTL